MLIVDKSSLFLLVLLLLLLLVFLFVHGKLESSLLELLLLSRWVGSCISRLDCGKSLLLFLQAQLQGH